MYRKDIYQGGWFSFNANKEDWKSHYAEKMYNTFFNSVFIEEKYSKHTVTSELLITNNLSYAGIKNKSVLVVGGGPSCEALTAEMLESYDYIFSCNHFYKNKFLNKYKIHLALIGEEVDLEDEQFLKSIKENNTIVGFEHSGSRNIMQLLDFKAKHPLTFLYITRYFSRLGYVARACVLARLLGANKIHFIGLDGFKTSEHYFEKIKGPPSFNDPELLCEQMRIFYHYILSELKMDPDKFVNLSDGHEESIYSGILQEVKNEIH